MLCGAAGGDRAWCPQALWCLCCSSACLLSRAVLCSSAAVPAFLGFGHCFQQLREARWLLGAGRSHCLQMKPRCSLDPGGGGEKAGCLGLPASEGPCFSGIACARSWQLDMGSEERSEAIVPSVLSWWVLVLARPRCPPLRETVVLRCKECPVALSF